MVWIFCGMIESTLTKWKTPLIENEKIVELPVDQRTITRQMYR